MKTLITLLFACCFGSAMAQSSLPECKGPVSSWNNCFGAESGPGWKFLGEFTNGVGKQGTLTMYTGTQYIGTIDRDRPVGYGRVIYADGDKYVGEWQGGFYNGQGIATYANGEMYVGEWRDAAHHGMGIEFHSDGSIKKSGIYEMGDLLRSETIDPKIFTRIRNDVSEKTVLAIASGNQSQNAKLAELEAQLAAVQQSKVKPTVSVNTQGKRVALVIGNAKYKFSPLNNPVNDATDMAASLRSVGFDVIEVRDANKRQMRAATRRFEDKLAASDVGLVYYSGHGVEVKGRNYLIPVDADIRREHEVEDQAFDAGNILRMMESLQGTEKNRVNIMIVDACRNNDLARSWRSTNRGLARMDAPTGSFISFATAPGQVASDGNGRNSPFTKHLLQALKQPNVPIELVFKEVRRNVMDETGGEQVPWENSSLVGDFYFTVAR